MPEEESQTQTLAQTQPAAAQSEPKAVKPKAKQTDSGPSRQERLALVARAKKLLETPNETPGREFVNKLRTEPNPERMKLIEDVESPIPESRIWEYENFKEAVRYGEAGFTWPLPAVVTVPRVPVGAKVVMDGDLGEPAWEKAMTWTDSYKFNDLEKSSTLKTTWKMLWDADYLYVGFVCEDDYIVSSGKERDQKVYSGDSAELFISPDLRYRGYWEIVVGPDNCVYDAIESKKILEWGPDLNPAENMPGLITCARRHGPDEPAGYSVEMAVPWSALLAQKNQRPRIGDRYAFMLARIEHSMRNGKRTGDAYAPVPLLGWAHNIWNMMTMELGG